MAARCKADIRLLDATTNDDSDAAEKPTAKVNLFIISSAILRLEM
jgi:hypothetical protein